MAGKTGKVFTFSTCDDFWVKGGGEEGVEHSENNKAVTE
jgi:hypothetical protein